MWLLGRLLPAMVGNFIPEGDEHWVNLVNLIQIMDFVMAPKLTADEATYLEDLIENHHEEFMRLYPDSSITPKMHYMVHMPRLIRQ